MSLVDEKVEQLQETDELKSVLGEIEMGVLTRFTLADAIRLGTNVSDQAYDWCDGEGNLCAMSAGIIAAKSLGYMD